MGNISWVCADKNETEKLPTLDHYVDIEKKNASIILVTKVESTRRHEEEANFVSIIKPKNTVNCKIPKKKESSWLTTEFTDVPAKLSKRSRNNVPEFVVSRSFLINRKEGFEMPKLQYEQSFQSNFTIDIKLQRFKEMDDIDEGLKNELEKGHKINSDYVMNLIEKLQDIEDLWQQEFEIVNINFPYCHWEHKISPNFKFKNVIDAVINPRKRVKWDTEIESFKTVNYFAKDCSLVQTKYNKSNFANAFETLEKRMWFKAESEDDCIVFVTYSSPVPESYNSSSSIYNFWITTFEAQEDGSTIINTFVQFNSNFRLENKETLSDSIKTRSVEWESNIINYLTSKLSQP